MSMRAKDFELVASVVREIALHEHDKTSLIRKLTYTFSTEYPLFDATRFVSACYNTTPRGNEL